MAPATLEILLVDDQLVVRRGVELLLRDAGFRIVGLGAGAEEASRLLRSRRFDVALVEAALGGSPTAALLRARLADRPGLPVVVYAGSDDAALREAFGAGVPGLVLKSSADTVLVAALRTVARGERFVDPAVVRRLSGKTPARRGIDLLSPREREILGLLAHGRSGAEIADELFLSGETVRTHVRNAIQKLGARTRTQAVALLVHHQGGLPDAVAVD